MQAAGLEDPLLLVGVASCDLRVVRYGHVVWMGRSLSRLPPTPLPPTGRDGRRGPSRRTRAHAAGRAGGTTTRACGGKGRAARVESTMCTSMGFAPCSAASLRQSLCRTALQTEVTPWKTRPPRARTNLAQTSSQIPTRPKTKQRRRPPRPGSAVAANSTSSSSLRLPTDIETSVSTVARVPRVHPHAVGRSLVAGPYRPRTGWMARISSDAMTRRGVDTRRTRSRRT